MDQAKVSGPTTALRPQKRWTWHVGYFVRRKPLGAAGGFSLLVVVLIAMFAPFVATHDPILSDIYKRLTPPGSQFWLGSDSEGRDLFSRIVFGARISLYVGMGSTLLGTLTGTFVGVASAYRGGKVDLLVQRLVDAMMGFPGLIIALVLVTSLGASLNNVVFAIAFSLSPRMVRLARSAALTVREQDYVLATRSIGAGPARIMLRHILPNSVTPVLVLATGYLGSSIIIEASLSYLGLGVPPPHPSWGREIFLGASRFLLYAPWLTIFPGLALTFTVFGINLFGDALRDSLDPRLRGT